MRLSDLLETEVFDQSGASLGHVQDVRLIQDGPVLGTFGAAFAIEGLIVGTRRFGERLGFHRTNMHGPGLVKRFFEWWHRGAKYVPWECVASLDVRRVVVAGNATEYGRPEPIDE